MKTSVLVAAACGSRASIRLGLVWKMKNDDHDQFRMSLINQTSGWLKVMFLLLFCPFVFLPDWS